MRKIVLLAALVGALCVPASAVAAQWYIQTPLKEGERNKGKRTRIPTGGSVEVATEGTMNLHVRLNDKYRDSFKCHAEGTEVLSNTTATEAAAETTSLTLTECDGAEHHPRRLAVVPLPFAGELGSELCMPCTLNRETGIEVEDEGLNYGVFEGVLNANVGDGDESIKDDLDHTLKWYPPGSTLENARGELVIGGSEELGAPGDHAAAEANGGAAEEEGEGKGE